MDQVFSQTQLKQLAEVINFRFIQERSFTASLVDTKLKPIKKSLAHLQQQVNEVAQSIALYQDVNDRKFKRIEKNLGFSAT